MRLRKITTGERSQKRNSKRVKATTIEADDDSTVKARVELDTRADTSCLGANFRYVSDRGDGFHGEFDTLQDVPIVRGVTGWKDPSTGKPYLLFINQGLWFGEKLDHSLLNPNQVRHFGTSASDNRWDESKKFGIDHDDVYIPFTSKGATVYFDTFRPSLADLEDKSFIHIELTDLGDDAKDLGRWLGHSKKVGTGMTYFILTRSGKVISTSSVQHVTQEDVRNDDTKAKVDHFNEEVRAKLNEEEHMIPVPDGENTLDDTTQNLRLLAQLADQDRNTVQGNGDSDEVRKSYATDVEDALKGNEDEFDQLDSLIGATVQFDKPEGVAYGKVTKRAPDDVENGFNHNADWKDFYGEMVEEDPAGMPVPLGEAVKIRTYLDADHAGNVVTRRSHTGILIFVNNSLIVQYSKKQNTVESATFGDEMVAMRIARDLTVALRIKLKMFGAPIDGPADFFCDNDSVVKNTNIPTSTLAKKHNSVNYHITRESAAAGILRVAKIPTEYNYSDALTKILPLFKRIRLLNPLLYMPSECNIIEDDTKVSGES